MTKMNKSDDQWRQALTPEQFRILREKGTERAFTGPYNDFKGEGVFKCAGCGQTLFTQQRNTIRDRVGRAFLRLQMLGLWMNTSIAVTAWFVPK
jgi:hypothetical protein